VLKKPFFIALFSVRNLYRRRDAACFFEPISCLDGSRYKFSPSPLDGISKLVPAGNHLRLIEFEVEGILVLDCGFTHHLLGLVDGLSKDTGEIRTVRDFGKIIISTVDDADTLSLYMPSIDRN